MRYVYLGDKLTDPALVGQECDPVRRPDGKCIISQRMSTALVRFADGSTRCVLRRRLRVVECDEDTHYWPEMPAANGEPGIGASCRCGLKRWKIEVHFPKPASEEEMAAFIAEVMAVEIPPDFDREEGLRRWLS